MNWDTGTVAMRHAMAMQVVFWEAGNIAAAPSIKCALYWLGFSSSFYNVFTENFQYNF